MRIGFIGSNIGMTAGQREALRQILAGNRPNEFHHSDRLGPDADAHAIAREACPTSRVIVHPPRDESSGRTLRQTVSPMRGEHRSQP